MNSVHFSAPPRAVPLSLRVLNFFNGFAQIGWLLFGFGMIFFWGFVANADFSFATFRNPSGRATGRVVEVKDTGASENKQPVQASVYEFSFAGQTFQGKSYTTGSAPSKGDPVTIEFDESNPLRSRIQGMRRGMFGPVVSFVTIFPAIGAAFIFFATRSGVKRNRLLRTGLLAQGTLIRSEPTNVTVNKRRVWELTFEFTDRSGRKQEAKARSSFPEKLEDEATEPLLYDPEDPSRAYVLDEAPSRPQIHPNGDLIGRPIAALFALILPGLAIVGHGLVVAAKLGLFR